MYRPVNTSALLPYLGYVSKQAVTAVDFPQTLAELRKRHSLFDEEEKRVIGSLLEGMIPKYEARCWQNVSANGGERR